MGECGQIGGPNRSEREFAPPIIAMLELDVRPDRVSLLVPVVHGCCTRVLLRHPRAKIIAAASFGVRDKYETLLDGIETRKE